MSRKIKRKKHPASKKQLLAINAQLQEALELHRSGLFDQAAVIYQKILTIHPGHGDTLNLFGSLCLQEKEYDKAVTLLKKATKLHPDRPDYFSNLGSAYNERGNFDAAEAAYKKGIALQPDHIGCLYNLAGVLVSKNKLLEAGEKYREILSQKPGMPEAIQQLIIVGTSILAQGKFTEALIFYQKTIKIVPNEGALYNDMANALAKLGKLHEALTAYKKAIKLNPDIRNAYINLAWIYREHGLLDEGIHCLNQLQATMGFSPQDHSDLLFSLNYSPKYDTQKILNAAEKWWQTHGIPQSKMFSHPTRPENKTKLTIGFVSPDFSRHPVGFFLAPLFRELDKEKIEIVCYAQMNDNQSDEITDTLKNSADGWHNISLLSDDQVAKQIFADQIDILIDLAGHTANNRLMVFARKPAPIQINWLGYVGTTGLAPMDYRITDNVVDPQDEEVATTETIYRLPNGFFCYSPHVGSPDYLPELPAQKNGFITFGSFNNLPKMTPEVITLWSNILQKTPHSQLLFTSSQFKDEAIIARYSSLFEKTGLNINRIHFHGSLPLEEYLRLISTVDIAWDPFPHNGHTITCDTLWMGVPVITLLGERYAGRMTASALTTLGLDNLIAQDKDEYLNKSVALASDIERLSSLRQGLRQRIKNSPMFDQKRFADDFQRALWDIWNKKTGEQARNL